MASFVLQPCHLREHKFAPNKGEPPLLLDWKMLVAKLAPSRDPSALSTLRSVTSGSYVGLAKTKDSNGRLVNFLLLNQDRSARLDWILRKDPSFETRLVEVYRVEEAKWDATVQEFDTPGRPPW